MVNSHTKAAAFGDYRRNSGGVWTKYVYSQFYTDRDAYSDAYSNSYAYTYTHSNSHRHIHAKSNGYSHANADSNGQSKCNANNHTKADPNAENCSCTETSADAGSSAYALISRILTSAGASALSNNIVINLLL